MRVVYDHKRDEAANITTFFFRPEKKLNYTAGQYIQLKIDHPDHDNRGQTRWFTLSSSPTDQFLSITTKFSSERISSFKKHLKNLKSGDVLFMSDPMGDFVLPQLIQTPLIFVAGGIGITPFHSMLSWLTDTKEVRPIKLIYGVNTEEEIIFQETFSRAHQHVSLIVNKPSAAWGGERGVLSPELILGLSQPTKESLIFVAGPEPMVEELNEGLLNAGVNSQQIVLDSFPHYTREY